MVSFMQFDVAQTVSFSSREANNHIVIHRGRGVYGNLYTEGEARGIQIHIRKLRFITGLNYDFDLPGGK